MDQKAFETGMQLYQSGDWYRALTQLNEAKEDGEVSGKIDHIRGNAYMQLSQYDAAAEAYKEALQDSSYGKVGALSCNEGRALLAAGRLNDAIEPLKNAVLDTTYATPYKAYMALGSIYEQLGDMRQAGISYRKAALDEANPEPSEALLKLAKSFQNLSRPLDAVETYRTALDYSSDELQKGKIYAGLGVAYMSANRVSESAESFEKAVDGTGYTLTDEEQAAYTGVKNALDALARRKNAQLSDTDEFLAQVGYASGYDPLDPTGSSGAVMPSPEDTGFFSVTEAELIKADKEQRKIHRKRHHTILKTFLLILFILILLEAAAALLYINGYGWPTQAKVAEELFDAKTNGDDISSFFQEGISEAKISDISDFLPVGAKISSSGVDQSMNESVLYVTVKLSEGGTQDFLINMYRSGISWKISDVDVEYLTSVSGVD